MTASQNGVDRQPNSRFVARMIESHSILGLSFAALIYVVSLTGAFTIYAPEIALWENPQTPTAKSASPQAYEAALSAALARMAPDYEAHSLVAYGPHPFQPALLVRLNERDASREFRQTDWIADPDNGELLYEFEAPLSHLIEELHVALHLPAPWGRYLVGLLGVCMFCLMFSGILAHPSIVRDAFKLRFERSPRVAWTDMHNRLSVWGLPYHLVITFTGGFLGIAGLIVGGLALVAYDGDRETALRSINGPQPIEGKARDTLPPVAQAIEQVRELSADSRFELLVVNEPGNDGGTMQINVLDARLLDARTGFVFRNSGQFLERYGGEGAPGGIRALAMIQPLHYGTFGGYTMKFIYFVLAIALTWVTSTGMKIWFSRRAQQGQPVPRIRAAWEGMTAGLSLGLALACLITVAGLGSIVLPALLVTWTVTLGGFLWLHDTQHSRAYSYVAAAVSILLAISLSLKLIVHGLPTTTGTQFVDGILLVLAAGFAWYAGVSLRPAAVPATSRS